MGKLVDVELNDGSVYTAVDKDTIKEHKNGITFRVNHNELTHTGGYKIKRRRNAQST